MTRRLRLAACTAALALALPRLAPAQAAPPAPPTGAVPATLQYKGFTVIDSAVQSRDNLPEIRAAMQAQLDMVLAVGLPEQTIAFFRTLQIMVRPVGAFATATSGRYTREARRVELVDNFVRNRKKPIVLHEFMHAFHAELLPGGRQNAELLAFFEQAKTRDVYNQKSHMMSNIGEFFACTTTAYLYGTTAQEPFSRAKLQQTQPELFTMLQGVFGAAAGTYLGVLQE